MDWQISSGSHGLVPVGTTGESPTLSHEEHRRVVHVCIDEARGRVPVIAGAGSNNTTEAIDLARYAEKAGADAALVVTPYYNKPTQEGLIAISRRSTTPIGIPILIYNIPPRSVVDMGLDTMKRLYELEEYRRRERRDRRRRPCLEAAPRDGAGLHPALRRRHDRAGRHGGGRARLHLGLRQRRARACAPN